MKIENPREEYLKQVEALYMIETQLAWLLKEADKAVDQVGSPLANEIVLRFYALYRDYQQVLADIVAMSKRFDEGQFVDALSGRIFQTNAHWLIRKATTGPFAHFKSVAETGDFPKNFRL